MARSTITTGTYVGTERPGVKGTGESLTTGAVVRVISVKGAVALVDRPSRRFGTGHTYTVWSVPAGEVVL